MVFFLYAPLPRHCCLCRGNSGCWVVVFDMYSLWATKLGEWCPHTSKWPKQFMSWGILFKMCLEKLDMLVVCLVKIFWIWPNHRVQSSCFIRASEKIREPPLKQFFLDGWFSQVPFFSDIWDITLTGENLHRQQRDTLLRSTPVCVKTHHQTHFFPNRKHIFKTNKASCLPHLPYFKKEQSRQHRPQIATKNVFCGSIRKHNAHKNMASNDIIWQ